LSSKLENDLSPYIKNYALRSAIDFDMRGNREAQLKFYFGPPNIPFSRNLTKALKKQNNLTWTTWFPWEAALYAGSMWV
jgi:hypothetical protein